MGQHLGIDDAAALAACVAMDSIVILDDGVFPLAFSCKWLFDVRKCGMDVLFLTLVGLSVDGCASDKSQLVVNEGEDKEDISNWASKVGVCGTAVVEPSSSLSISLSKSMNVFMMSRSALDSMLASGPVPEVEMDLVEMVLGKLNVDSLFSDIELGWWLANIDIGSLNPIPLDISL